ncbi:MAG TPA: hypothetical protein VF983_10995 [Streptosporangiaceae bacterium]
MPLSGSAAINIDIGKSRVGQIETGKWQVVEPVIGEHAGRDGPAWRGPAAARAIS